MFLYGIEENDFVFEDLIPVYNFYEDFEFTFLCAPQNDFGEALEIEIDGTPIDLIITETEHSSNLYQWTKNGTPITENGNFATYTIENPTAADARIYSCIVTNTELPELILERKAITITAVPEPDRDALVALYNATNGDNWTVSWDLNTNYLTWEGLTLNDANEVVRIDLSNNNLVGFYLLS